MQMKIIQDGIKYTIVFYCPFESSDLNKKDQELERLYQIKDCLQEEIKKKGYR